MIDLNKTYNPLGSPLTKWYNKPVKDNEELLQKISTIKKSNAKNLALMNGEWHAVIQLINIYCKKENDAVAFFAPSRNLYKKATEVLHKQPIELKLTEDFEMDMIALENLLTPNCKLLFINYPNNPTGNCFSRDDIYFILNNFNGFVVIDEAYINYSRQKSFLQDMADYPNLIVLQSFNYAWGLAGLHVALIAGNENEISAIKNTTGENCINQPTFTLLNEALDNLPQVNAMITETIELKKAFENVLKKFPFVQEVYKSDANFLLVKCENAVTIYNHLQLQNIHVKNCSDEFSCNNCLRITIGTEQQLTALVDALLLYN